MDPLIPVILSGGAGTCLWPVSREALPKPFIKLPDGESLLVKTLLRAAALPDVTAVLTVTNRDHYFLTRDEFIWIGLCPCSTTCSSRLAVTPRRPLPPPHCVWKSALGRM